MINTAAFAHRLTERRNIMLTNAIATLEAGIAAGLVKNADYNDAKDTINRAVSDAFNHYQDETRDFGGKLIMSAHDVVSGIKQAKGQPARLAILTALLPLAELIAAAKPLIVKRGDARMPVAPKTPEQIAKEARQMTCQCCGRLHLANTGVVAHHGYQRPGQGWQTASCIGARELPFEVSRDRLGVHIENMKEQRDNMVSNRDMVEAETVGFHVDYETNKRNERTGRSIRTSVEVTRETWNAVKAQHDPLFSRYGRNISFDAVKASELDSCNREIKSINDYITECQTRYDGWKQTHSGFDKASETWIKI